MELFDLLKTRKFIEEISKSVNSIIFKRFSGLRPGEREDVGQEVLLKIWKMASYGKKIDNLKSYLWRVVYTTALDIMEKRMNEISLEESAELPISCLPIMNEFAAPETQMEKEEMKRCIEKIIESLPESRRTVLKLHLAGMDLDETAKFLQWTYYKVRHLFYRGLKDLRKRLLNEETAKTKTDKLYEGRDHARAKVH